MDRAGMDRQPSDGHRGLSVDDLLGLNYCQHQPKDVYKIGELAREFGVTLRALRFYENRGFLRPARSGATRLYSAADRQRLRIVLLGKALGFTLVEAKELIALHVSSETQRSKTEATIERFAVQKTELDDQKQRLESSIATLETSIEALERQLATLPR